MRVRLAKDWKTHKAGKHLDVPDGAATELLRRKIAEHAPPVEAAAAGDEPPADPKPKRAKKPKK